MLTKCKIRDDGFCFVHIGWCHNGWIVVMVGKCGKWEAPSQEMLKFGGKFWNLVGNFVFLYIRIHKKLWENWPASSWEIKPFSQSCVNVHSQIKRHQKP